MIIERPPISAASFVCHVLAVAGASLLPRWPFLRLRHDYFKRGSGMEISLQLTQIFLILSSLENESRALRG